MIIKTRITYVFSPFQYTPVKSHLRRIVVGSDQEMCHVGKHGHQLVAIYLPPAMKISEVLRHESNHVQVLFIGLQ